MSVTQWITAPFDHDDDTYKTARSLWTAGSTINPDEHHYDMFLEEMEEVETFFACDRVIELDELEISFYSGNENDNVLAMTDRIIGYADKLPLLKWLKVDSYFFEDFPTWKILDAFPDLKAFYMEGTGCDWGIRRMHNLEYLVLDQGNPKTALQGCAFPALKHFSCNKSGDDFASVFNSASFTQLIHLGLPDDDSEEEHDKHLIDRITLPSSLRSLTLETYPSEVPTGDWTTSIEHFGCDYFSSSSVRSFGQTNFPNLISLDLSDGDEDNLKALAEFDAPASLKTVKLTQCSLNNSAAELLTRIAWLKNVDELDLSDNHFSDEEVVDRIHSYLPNAIMGNQSAETTYDDEDEDDFE